MLMLDETARQRARQDLFEAISAGMIAPCGADTTFTIELLEIAARERRVAEHVAIDEMIRPTRLTIGSKQRRMAAWFSETGKAFLHAASRFWRGLGARRLHA